jgi:hypothetical protein
MALICEEGDVTEIFTTGRVYTIGCILYLLVFMMGAGSLWPLSVRRGM